MFVSKMRPGRYHETDEIGYTALDVNFSTLGKKGFRLAQEEVAGSNKKTAKDSNLCWRSQHNYGPYPTSSTQIYLFSVLSHDCDCVQSISQRKNFTKKKLTINSLYNYSISGRLKTQWATIEASYIYLYLQCDIKK